MNRRLVVNGAIWLVLLTAALWLPLIGGYMALGSRVLIYALGAMALYLLLGFTGCMSFGQAAGFGLGGYGAGLFPDACGAAVPWSPSSPGRCSRGWRPPRSGR